MTRRPLFVFGTLRQGEANHHLLAGRYVRYLPATLPGYRRGVARHGFPAVYAEPGAIVRGELYFLRETDYDDTLRVIDELEDLLPGQLVGPYYRRAEVAVETVEGRFSAWGYVDPGSLRE